MMRLLLSMCSLAHVAYAYHMPMPVARTAVRNQRAAISMVIWERVPQDMQWTKHAWEAMGLSANCNTLHACVPIPDQYVPDQGFKRSRTWYFCTYNGATKAGMAKHGYEMPTYQPDSEVFLCSMGHGARPSYAE